LGGIGNATQYLFNEKYLTQSRPSSSAKSIFGNKSLPTPKSTIVIELNETSTDNSIKTNEIEIADIPS
jgi:hypothetical protein